MNLIQDISDSIQNTPIIQIDDRFLNSLDPLKAYEGKQMRPEYHMMIESLGYMLDDSERRGIPRDRALAVVLATHEDMIRYVIKEAVTKRLAELGEEAYMDVAKTKGVMEMRAYLRYSADRWGNKEERKAVKSLVEKVIV